MDRTKGKDKGVSIVGVQVTVVTSRRVGEDEVGSQCKLLGVKVS